MGVTVSIKQNDTARQIQDTLLFGGIALNLTGASVVLIFKNADTGVATRRVATITSAANGQVAYQLVSGDTAIAGTFQLEWEVTLPGGSIISIPDDSYHTLMILSDLG